VRVEISIFSLSPAFAPQGGASRRQAPREGKLFEIGGMIG